MNRVLMWVGIVLTAVLMLPVAFHPCSLPAQGKAGAGRTTDSKADQAVALQMQKEGLDIQQIGILDRAPVGGEYELVIAYGLPSRMPMSDEEGVWLYKSSKLGIYLQRRDEPESVFRIAVEGGFGDTECYARVERVTETDTVIACTDDRGARGPNIKFVYDIQARSLVKRITYRFRFRQLFIADENAVMIGTDFQQPVAFQYSPEGDAFTVLSGAQAEEWTKRGSYETVGLGRGRIEIHQVSPPFTALRFGSAGKFLLDRDKVTGTIRVLEDRDGKTIQHLLPQSTYDAFAAARPQRVKDGYSRDYAQIEESIGPTTIFNDTLWFGKTFYDGEGYTGIGGFGFFDTQALEYRIWSPEEVVDWSANALFVEKDAIWLGLSSHGEGSATSGGLVRFDLKTHDVEKLKLHDIAYEIVRLGQKILVATDVGAALVEDHKVRRYFVDKAADGRLIVVEATTNGQ